MEYIGVAGRGGEAGGTNDFDVMAWAPYIGGAFLIVFLVVMFGMRRR